MLDGYEVFKIVCFLSLVGIFWWAFTVERQTNKSNTDEIALLKHNLTKAIEKKDEEKKAFELRLDEWTKSAIAYKAALDQIGTKCESLADTQKTLKAEQKAMQRDPKPQVISIDIRGALPGTTAEIVPQAEPEKKPASRVKSKTKEAKANLRILEDQKPEVPK